jgi:hypothetical protein
VKTDKSMRRCPHTLRPNARFPLAPLFVAAAALFLLPPASHAQDKIITWGANTPDWNDKLHVSAVRVGCSSAPESCMAEVNQEASQDHVKTVFLSILLKNPQTVADAAQYATLSGKNPKLVEIGFDDFVSQAQKLGMDPSSLTNFLAQMASALKLGNSHLKLGLTIYENELGSQWSQLGIGKAFSDQVDFVHLYPHYRHETEPFGNYVNQAKNLFPNAQIIAGVYAYDRRDYLPCAKGSSDHCSNDQELSLFKDMFQQELALLRSGQVAWLEFYPGAFGMEDRWRNWDQARICSPSRRQECVDNTKAMRQQVLQILSGR